MDKYRLLTSDTKVRFGTTYYRVQALKNFGDVRVGELGGYVNSEDCLSQEGDGWVSKNTYHYSPAHIFPKVAKPAVVASTEYPPVFTPARTVMLILVSLPLLGLMALGMLTLLAMVFC